MSQPTRISRLFESAQSGKRKVLIAYLTAGDPTPEHTPGLVAALERGGCDLLELGIPFSDPIADGPVIQRGADRALRAGTSVSNVLEIAAQIRKQSEIPLLLFTYLNPVLRYGLDRLGQDAKAAGIDGCLMIDLSVEEAGPYTEAMRKHGLDTVFLAAPTSTPRRLKLAAQYSSGFIYLVSRTGVTGERESLSGNVEPLVKALRAETGLPLAVGFGISTPEQVRATASAADGVVVGSAFVRVIEEHLNEPGAPMEAALEARARELASGLSSKH
jgi:tryptophan synthase alpha chain